MHSSKPRLFVQSFSDMHAPRQPQIIKKQLSGPFFCSLVFMCCWRHVAFSEYALYNYRLVCPCMECTSYVFSPLPDDGVFYLVTTGWIYDISLSENSIIQPKTSLLSDDCPPSCLFPIHHHPQPRSSPVVYQIQRIGCQPEKITFLHGGQSCSWSAEQGNEI